MYVFSMAGDFRREGKITPPPQPFHQIATVTLTNAPPPQKTPLVRKKSKIFYFILINRSLNRIILHHIASQLSKLSGDKLDPCSQNLSQ